MLEKVIGIDSYEDKFLCLIQNYFCNKYNLSRDEYIGIRNKISLDNELFYFEDMDIKINKLDNDFSKFDSYLSDDDREKTGSYYTPKELANAMITRTISDYLIKNSCFNKIKTEKLLFDNINTFKKNEEVEFVNALENIKYIDISVGTGVFLLEILEIYKNINTVLTTKIDFLKVLNNIYGIDIQSKPLEVLMILMYDFMLEEKLVNIKDLPNLNILNKNSLIDKINLEFKFDIVIGNPPYVGEKGNRDLFNELRKIEHLKEYSEGRMDLFYYFIYVGFNLLSDNGLLCYITTNYFVTADGASKLRKFLKEKSFFVRLINFDECKLFKEAKGMHNLIFTLTKTVTENTYIQYINKSTKEFNKYDIYDSKYSIKQSDIFSENNNILIYETEYISSIINKIVSKSDIRLNEIAKINQGIVSGADRVSKTMFEKKFSDYSKEKNKILINEGIYVFENNNSFKSKYFRPFYKNSDIEHYYVNPINTKQILYITDQSNLIESEKEWNHLERFQEVLNQRREVQTKSRKWYALQWSRDESIFESEKIIVPQRSLRNYFGYSNFSFYSSADVYYITKTDIPIKYLLGYLNSKLLYFWLYNRGKRKGKSLELYAKPLSQIPIIQMSSSDEKYIIECVENILNRKGEYNKLTRNIDEMLYKYYNITEKEKSLIELAYN